MRVIKFIMHKLRRIACAMAAAFLLAAPGARAQTFREEGGVAFREGDFARAADLFERSLATALKVMKEDDIDIIERRLELGEAYAAAGRTDDAVRQLDYVWKRARYESEHRKGWSGKEGATALGSGEKLGRLYQASGRYEDAMLVFATALHDAERTEHHEDALQFVALLAETQFVAKKDVDAAMTAARAFSLAEKVKGSPTLQARALSQLSLMCLRHRQLGLAKPMAERALERARAAMKTEPPKGTEPASAEAFRSRQALMVADCQARLAGVLVQTGALDDADELLGNAREAILEVETPQSTHLVDVLLASADLTLKEDRPEDARKLAEQALDICRKKFPDLHPQTGRALEKAGDCQLALKQPHLAKPLYEKALAIFVETLGADDPLTAETREQIAKIGPAVVIPAGSSAEPAPGR